MQSSKTAFDFCQSLLRKDGNLETKTANNVFSDFWDTSCIVSLWGQIFCKLQFLTPG